MSAPKPEHLAALGRCWEAAQGEGRRARVVLAVLLGCYNGRRFRFDLTDLRLLDGPRLADVIAVLEMDANPEREIHQHLNELLGRRDTGPRLELLAHDWGIRGAVDAAEADRLRARPHL